MRAIENITVCATLRKAIDAYHVDGVAERASLIVRIGFGRVSMVSLFVKMLLIIIAAGTM
jgi:hypothetical protein